MPDEIVGQLRRNISNYAEYPYVCVGEKSLDEIFQELFEWVPDADSDYETAGTVSITIKILEQPDVNALLAERARRREMYQAKGQQMRSVIFSTMPVTQPLSFPKEKE